MLETPHVAVGAAIATQVVHPALAIPLAFASHFLLEKVPHWNPHLNSETEKFGKPTKQSSLIVVGDVICSLILGFYVSSRVLPNFAYASTILLSCFASVLPDVVEALIGLFYFFDNNYKNYSWYKSGRVGFAGLTVLGIFFVIRAGIALVLPFMLSFLGKFETFISGVVAFIFFFLVIKLSGKYQ